MSFSSLPTELVRQIIESSVPSTFHSTTYIDRQSTLRVLCLVSHRFLPIAQPLLAEIVWLESLERLNDTLDVLELQHTCQALRQMAILSAAATGCASMYLRKLATSSPGLEFLSADLSMEQTLGLGVFGRFKNLRSLQLACDNIVLDSPFVLAHLESFAIQGMVTDVLTNFLQPAKLPSLRYLAIKSPKADPLAWSGLERSANLYPQLQALFLDVDVLTHAPDCLVLALDRTLFDLQGYELPYIDYFRDIQHLRVATPHTPSLLVRLTLRIQLQGSARLKSIYLDSSLDPANPTKARDVGYSEELQRACSEKGIVLVYEKQGSEWFDSWISEDFSRRQKEPRKKSGTSRDQ